MKLTHSEEDFPFNFDRDVSGASYSDDDDISEASDDTSKQTSERANKRTSKRANE